MNAVEDALYDWLAADAGVAALVGTRIYRQAAPEGEAGDFIILQHHAGGDENLTPADSQDLYYQVRGVSRTSPDAAGAIDDSVRARLHGATLTVSGWTNFWTSRQQAIRFTETDEVGSARRYHAGAFYRIRLDD